MVASSSDDVAVPVKVISYSPGFHPFSKSVYFDEGAVIRNLVTPGVDVSVEKSLHPILESPPSTLATDVQA